MPIKAGIIISNGENMCEHNINGICMDPSKHEQGVFAIKCENCPKQNMIETPDSKKEYINPVFR